MNTPKRACRQRERHSKFLSYLTGARYVHFWWCGRCKSCNQVLATHVARVWQELDYRIDICRVTKGDISSTCKVGQELWASLPLLTCSPSACPCRLLYRRGRNSRGDLWITLYFNLLRTCSSTSKVVCAGYVSPLTLILRRSHTGTVWFYTYTSNKTAARPKLYTKSFTRDLKRMYSRLTLVRISINL